jgi:hypothetical protein
MTTIPQNEELLNQLFELLAAHRSLYGQERVYQRMVSLVLAEVFSFGRHTVTQLLLTLGMNDSDWSAWYRLWSAGRFKAEASSAVLVGETLKHVAAEAVYVVVGDGTQTPRSSSRMEGVGWLRNPRTPPFKLGIHRAQRWFNGSWLLPEAEGYSRALPLCWLPAFSPKSHREVHEACKEWEAALDFLGWLRGQLAAQGRERQPILMLGDGGYDTLGLWKGLPEGVTLLVRTAKNRVLHHLPPAEAHGNRKYGERAPTPQDIWQRRQGWHKVKIRIRGQWRTLSYQVQGPFLRPGAPDRPLFLLVVRGQHYLKGGRRKQRQPVAYLVNAVQDTHRNWVLPLAVATLLLWAWQRWEVEVCHRELKSTFGLGDKQCFNPHAAVASVQWSAWVYSLLLLAAYRTWGLLDAPAPPTRWWHGSGRWSFSTLWRTYRAALWGSHEFHPLWHTTRADWHEKAAFEAARANAIYGAARF